jgi:rhodanese-related sulfurtransferase
VSAPSWRRWLAGSALLAGALAPFAGSPLRARRASIDVEQLAGLVAREEDHVSAVQLAAWLAQGRPGLRVVDVRSAAEFAAFHIPGAESVPLERLRTARFAASDTIVLYSETGVHAAQAWVFLHALGHRNVLFLRRGLHEWLDDVVDARRDERRVAAPPAGTPPALRGRGC